MTMIPKCIRKLIAKICEWYDERERDMEEWRKSDPDSYYTSMMEQWQQK